MTYITYSMKINIKEVIKSYLSFYNMFLTSYSTVFMISLNECYENSHEDTFSKVIFLHILK